MDYNCQTAPNISPIHLNQVGYRTDDEKVAFITSGEHTFNIFNSDHRLVFTGDILPSGIHQDNTDTADEKSGDTLWEADFSSIKEDGTYYLSVGDNKSPVFKIGNTVYKDLNNAVLKLFYYQRCGGNGVQAEYIS